MKNAYKYEEIIQEHLGKEYMYNVEYIKDNQCKFCDKACSRRCRLNIQSNKCINYKDN